MKFLEDTSKFVSELKEAYFSPDLSLNEYIVDDLHRARFYQKQHTEPQAPYALLSNISAYVDNDVIYDIGTYEGCSALALASNRSNTVMSYDIRPYVRVKNPGNIKFILGNFFDDPGILKSPIISFDTDPHDGILEHKAHNWLVSKNYKGLVIYDDIRLNQNMINFWDSIKLEKVDVTEIGHYSGTGLVFYRG